MRVESFEEGNLESSKLLMKLWRDTMNLNPEVLTIIWLLPGIFCFCIAIALHSIPTMRNIMEKFQGKIRKKQRGTLKEAPQTMIQSEKYLTNSAPNM